MWVLALRQAWSLRAAALLFAEQGVLFEGSDRVPFAAAGHEVYDGQGKVKGKGVIALD